MALADSNVIIDIIQKDSAWHQWSASQLEIDSNAFNASMIL